MSDYFKVLASYEREGFTIIVDQTYDDTSIRDSFDDSCYDISDMEQRVNSGELEWFILRARALLDGHVMGTGYLGGCLYHDAREVLTDGVAEDVIEEALREARRTARTLLRSLQKLVDAA